MKVIVAVLLYLIGIGLVILSVFLTYSTSLNDYLHNVNEADTTTGFKLFAFVGIIRLITFLAGIFLIVLLTVQIIKEKRKIQPLQ
jgi:hypothetical protein